MVDLLFGAWAILGFLMAVGSFCEVSWRRPRVLLLIIGLLFVAIPSVYFVKGVVADPISDETDIETRPKPAPIVASLQEKLTSDFYAYDYPAWPVALELAICSSDAYSAPVFAEQALTQRGFKSVRTLNFGATLGYIATLDDIAVIMFRGTNPTEIQDWLVNVKSFTNNTDHGTVHAGFWYAYSSLHDQVQEVLRQSKIKRVWITGHSLGGAMAVVCSYHLMNELDLEIAGVMTFGQPCVGDAAFCEYMDKGSWGGWCISSTKMMSYRGCPSASITSGHWSGTQVEKSADRNRR